MFTEEGGKYMPKEEDVLLKALMLAGGIALGLLALQKLMEEEEKKREQ